MVSFDKIQGFLGRNRDERQWAIRMVLSPRDVPKGWNPVSLRLVRAGKGGKSEIARRAWDADLYAARRSFRVRPGEEFWAKILPAATRQDAEGFPGVAPSWLRPSPDFVGSGTGPFVQVLREAHPSLANATFWECEVYHVPGTSVNRMIAGAVDNITFAVGIGDLSPESPWNVLTSLAIRQADRIREALDQRGSM